jgi:hypothetical protein
MKRFRERLELLKIKKSKNEQERIKNEKYLADQQRKGHLLGTGSKMYNYLVVKNN